ncbi:MAG: cation diffusion facilitator family transporter [Oscillospiraceae bacterium]|nr:cation diffusion facilitator family transporter [Oscillospiraceae bacterium]
MKNLSLSNEQIAMQASKNTIYCNILLSVFKLIAGIIGNSAAMLADSIHSFSDLFTTFIVMAGVKLANKKTDKNHPYGHERFECVAAVILSVILAFTGIGIGWAGIRKIFEGNYGEIAAPGIIALVAAVITIIVKAALYQYKRRAAKKINSGALMADAWHHLSDSLSSVGSFLGILGARLGFPVLDPLAAVVICLFILKVALDIFRDSVGKMTDKACGEETEEEMRKIILSNPDVSGIDLLKTRLFGDKIYVDVEISTNGSETLHKAHETAHIVHDAIEAAFPEVKHCSVHINPTEKSPEDLPGISTISSSG